MKTFIIAVIVLLASTALSQEGRYDSPGVNTTAIIGGVPLILKVVPNAAIRICTYSLNPGIPCASLAATFTDSTGATPCSAISQVVLAGTNTCTATADGLGNFGFWGAPGTYVCQITASGITTTNQTCTAYAPGPTLSGSNTFNGTNIFNGSTTAGILNGAYNAASCANSPAPSWCSGTDIGAWVNAAMAACPSPASCRVVIPAGSYTQTTTINITNPAAMIIGDSQGNGSTGTGTLLSYTGSGDSIFIQNGTIALSGIVVQDLQIIGTNSGRSGIHFADIQNVKTWRVMVSGFTAGTAFWLDNQSPPTGTVTWDERNSFIEDTSFHNQKGWRFTVNGGTASFARTNLLSCHINLNASQTGISLESGVLYNSIIQLDGNADQAGATVISEAASVSSQENDWSIRMESLGAGTFISMGAGSFFSGRGRLTGASTNLVNSINATARLYIVGSPDQTQGEVASGAIGPSLIPNVTATGNFYNGYGFNLRWDADSGNWLANSDGSHNGASGIFQLGDANTSIGFFTVPDTVSANNQSVSPATLLTDKAAQIDNVNGLSTFEASAFFAHGTTAMPTGALAANTCSAAVTVATTNVTTSMHITWNLASTPVGVNGYGNSPVTIFAWLTAGNVNFIQCATTAVTPGAMSLSWTVY